MNALGELTLEEDAALTIDAALRRVIASLDPAGLETHALPPAAMVSAATAVHLAQAALAETDIQSKMQLAMASSYAAAFFGLPRNNLLYVIDQVCGMFAMTSSQRRDYHARATALLDNYVMSLKKGSAMSGAYKDGSLGMLQSGAFRDGSLGQAGAFRDGSLGILQNGAFQDGSLGILQNGAFQDGSLGRTGYKLARRGLIARRRPQLRGLGGGCGCSGVGADEVAVEAPFYKKPLVIAGAAAALGVVIYAISKR